MKIYPLSTCIISAILLMASFSDSWGNESIKGAYKASALVGKSVKNLEVRIWGKLRNW